MNTYDINDVLKVGNPLDEGSNFKCIKCNQKGELTFAPAPINDWSCGFCGQWQQESPTTQQSRIIHAELKNGSNYKYLWLGNDNFADLFNSWDFESNEGKYEGMLDFDHTVSFTIEMDEIKDEQSIIGMSFDEGLEDSEIVDFTLENINWR